MVNSVVPVRVTVAFIAGKGGGADCSYAGMSGTMLVSSGNVSTYVSERKGLIKIQAQELRRQRAGKMRRL